MSVQIACVIKRALLLIAVAASFTGCDTTLEDILLAPDPAVVYVREPARPVYFDPYYNQPKYYQQPMFYHESTSKKTKGNKVFKTTTVKNQYGQTVYKNTTSSKKKKKK